MISTWTLTDSHCGSARAEDARPERCLTIPELQAALIADIRFGRVGPGPLIDVTCVTIWRRAQQAARRAIGAGQLVPGCQIGTHILRHSFARHLLLNGIPLHCLRRWLSHSTIAYRGRRGHRN